MLLIEDLTCLNLHEKVNYDLELGWWIAWCRKDDLMRYGYRLKSDHVDLFLRLCCSGVVDLNNLGCTLRKNHSGPHLSWHPDQGIMKVADYRFPL